MTAIRVELELEDGSFTTRMLNAGQTVRQFHQQVANSSPALRQMAAANLNVIRSVDLADKSTKGFLSTLRDVSIVAGILSLGIGKLSNISHTWIGDIVRINAEMERLTLQMRSMSRSADPVREAAESIAYLRKTVQEVPFSLQAVANGFVKLKATGTDPLDGSLNSILNGIAAFGGSDNEFNRSILAISQMSGKGVIQMEELRQQLGESMPRAVELMARSMGISMATLIDDISTGTVQAKQALRLLYDELDATYGNRARMMMNTFDGQLRKTISQLQILTDTSGEGFFKAVKEQLADLNDFLVSDGGKNLADQLGDGLEAAVGVLRQAVDFVITFRREITQTGLAVAAFFTFRAGINSLSMLSAAFTTLNGTLQVSGMQFAQAGRQLWLLQVMMRSGAPAATMLGQGIATIGTAMRAAVTGFMAAAPWIAAIGLAVYTAAEYFDWFGNRVRNAYEDLKQFGAESRAAAQEAISARKAQLEAELAGLEAMNRPWQQAGMNGIDPLLKSEFERVRSQLDALSRESEAIMARAGQREDQRVLSDFQAQLDERLAKLKGFYDRSSNEETQRYLEQRAAMIEAGESIGDLDQKYADEQLARRQKLLDDEEALYRESLAQQEDALRLAANAQNAGMVTQIDTVIDYLQAQLSTVLEAQRELQNAKFGSSPMIPKPLNEDAQFKKGQQHLERLQAEVKGLAAELVGANAEVVELQELLASGKYGPQDVERVRELSEALVQAQRDKEALDVVLAGQKSLEDDIERARMRAIEKRLELQERASGKELTDAERIRLRIENGLYDGFGPLAKMREGLGGIVTSLDANGLAAANVANQLQAETFGTRTVSRIETVTSKLMEMARVIGAMGNGLDNLDFAGLSTGLSDLSSGMSIANVDIPADVMSRMELAKSMLMGKGWSNTAASGIVGNLGGESGMNTAAIGDGGTSGGLAQWHNERWDDLKAFASARGQIWTDFQTQIDFLDHELRTKYADTASKLQMVVDPAVAADIFMREFERPSDAAMAQSGPTRRGYAQQLAGASAGGAPSTYSPVAPSLEAHFAQQDAKINQTLADLLELNLGNQATEDDVVLKEAIDEIKAATTATQVNNDGLGKNLQAWTEAISNGTFGADKDPNSARYADLIAAAKELDRIEEEMDKRREATAALTQSDLDFKQRQIDLTNRLQEANERMLDPLQQKSTTAYRNLRTELDKYVTDALAAYGKESQAYEDAVAFRSAMLTQFRNVEIAEARAAGAERVREINLSLMTESQRRQFALDQEIQRIRREVDEFEGSAEDRVRIEQQAQEQIAALRAQAAAQSPIAKQMREWADISGNLEEATTGWLDSISDGFADLLTGTNNFRDIAKGIINDLAKMGIKWMMSSMMGGKGAGGGTAKTAASKMATGGKGKVPVAHTGGIAGSASLAARVAHSDMFKGARRFHGGGLPGGMPSMAPRLTSREVPIIVEDDEGIFTKEQMAAMAPVGRGGVTIHAPVTVNGSGGTNEQNQDLAERTAREMERMMRGMFVQEVARQGRPGNMLNNKSR